MPKAKVLIQDVPGVLSARGSSNSRSAAHAQCAVHCRTPTAIRFDRMLAAQSLLENVPIISGDEALADFGAQLSW